MLDGILPLLWAASEECYDSPRYRWDNVARPDGGAYYAVQRTLSGAAFFDDHSGRRFVRAGEAMLFTHHEPSVYGYPPEATEPYRQQFVTFSPGSLRSFFEDIRREFGSIVRMSPEGEAAVLFEEMLHHRRRGTFRDALHTAEILFRLLVAICREQINARQTEDPITFCHHLLTDDIAGKLGLKEIARRAGISREHFGREYVRRFGETPGAVLRRLRLERAGAMLHATGMTIDEIASSCGFSGADSFRRSYHSYFGRNPSKARK